MKPWEFQNLRLEERSGSPGITARCGLCGSEVTVDLEGARPALRMGLGLVTAPDLLQRLAGGAASALDSVGGPLSYLQSILRARPFLGELDSQERAGLIITLDEVAELEALEAEWREAEEMAAIIDGELTQVPGFESFRRELLEG